MTESPQSEGKTELKDILKDGIEYVQDLKTVLVTEREAIERRDTSKFSPDYLYCKGVSETPIPIRQPARPQAPLAGAR